MATTQDDAFREIQLNGKQLVFMGMAVVVIAVAIFLMGVQVGRGVRGERGLAEGADVVAAATTTETEPPLPPASVIQGSTETPLTAGEKLSYAERLTGNTEGEALKTDPEPALPAEAPTPKSETPMTAPLPPAPSAAAPTPAPAAPVAYVLAPAKGAPAVYRVRVGHYKERREADTMAARLQKEEQFKPWVVR